MNDEKLPRLEDVYSRVSCVCGRSEFANKLKHAVTLSGLPNKTGNRSVIPPGVRIDYRLAFDGSGWVMLHARAAGVRLRPADFSLAGRLSGWNSVSRGPERKDWPRALPEGCVIIDQQIARRAISRAVSKSRPGDAAAVWTDLRIAEFEAAKIIKVAQGESSRQAAATDLEIRKILLKAIAERASGIIGQRQAWELVKGRCKRTVALGILKELSGSRLPGRPKK